MTTNDATHDSRLAFQGNTLLAISVFAVLLFGIKLWLIGTYGNATPYWDQWDAEAMQLYRPFQNGTLDWKDLFSAHNEHRILTTRLFDLALLCINGIWNPLLQMVANAVLHTLTLIFSIVLLSRVVGRKYLPYLLVFSLFLFGLPFGWENTLEGFQTQFYFVILFSFACLWLTVTQTPLSVWWWVGTACAILSFLSFASGILALAASAAIGAVFYVAELRKTRAQLISVAILGGLFILGWSLTPTVAGHAYLHATSIPQFIDVLMAVLGWPIPTHYFSALILNAPNVFFAFRMLRRRSPTTDRRWFLLALCIWATAQIASIAYGRVEGYFSSRYTDLFSIGILVNFACLISLVQDDLGKFNRRKIDCAVLWFFIVAASLGLFSCEWNYKELYAKRSIGQIEEANTKNYLATGDFSYIKDKPFLEIPYPGDGRAFSETLAMPEIKAILPSNIRSPLASSKMDESSGAFIQGAISPETPKRSNMIFGSYAPAGKTAIGQTSLQFSVPQITHLAIPVAGYPLAEGNKIEIVQNGQRRPLIVRENPEDYWATIYTKVDAGPFSIVLSKSSASSWFAIEAPTVVGKLDAFIKSLLASSIWFMVAGLVIGITFWVHYGLTNGTKTETAQ